ncbi:MAG: alpha-E domain-containing protein [Gammaproteobacteria bacterium]
MLSRVAETIYWMGRYIERAENTARLTQVSTNLLMDLPRGITPGWRPLVVILGGEQAFEARWDEYTERRVVHFIVGDLENHGSTLSSLAFARENARTIRDIIPREAWEKLNELYHQVSDGLQKGLTKHGRFEFLSSLIEGIQTLTGILAGSMNHDAAYSFFNIGRKLERADMTTRMIDVQAATIMHGTDEESRAIEGLRWMAVLKSLTGYQMYRRAMQVRIQRGAVLDFLFHHEDFPRAVRYCHGQMVGELKKLPHHDIVKAALDEFVHTLDGITADKHDDPSLHDAIDELQLGLIRIHQSVVEAYFLKTAEQEQSQAA